jgi:glycerophosphoryl diester phosphodiesterase
MSSPFSSRRRSWRNTPLIAHRGASGYAPEHTLEAFALALRQGADLLEHDLHVTKDGALVCLHDLTLNRTTNVADIFPSRGRGQEWFVHDFTLAEIKQLDAGSWFGAAFAGARVPTFQEAIDLVRGKAALCSELKDPEVYDARGVDLVACYLEQVRRNGLHRPSGSLAAHVVQSFHEPTMRRAAQLVDETIDRTMLVEPFDAATWAEPGPLRAIAAFATGFGPGKPVLETRPELVQWAHDAGLLVSPWTFRATSTGRFPDVRTEMRYYVDELDVDRCITDYPDLFPRASRAASRRALSS